MEGVVEGGAERDAGPCSCRGSLDVLREVQRAHERRLERVQTMSGEGKLQKQVEVLELWVGDLVGQNTLLARAVEELEAEATTHLLVEKKRHAEMVSELRGEVAVLRRRLARKDSDLRGLVEVLRRLREFDHCTVDGIHFFEITMSDIFGSVDRFVQESRRGICGRAYEVKGLNETLQKEIAVKDREIRQITQKLLQYEQTVCNLRNELVAVRNRPNVATKDVEIQASIGHPRLESGDWEPVKDLSALCEELRDKHELLQKTEEMLKSRSAEVRSLRAVTVSLHEELGAMRGACAALLEQARVAAQCADFKDDLVREMRRQLKHAKAQCKEAGELVKAPCRVRQRLRAARSAAGEECRSPRLVVSGDEFVPLDSIPL